MSMIENSYLSLGAHGFHRIVYSEWKSAAGGRTVVCVHGLTRNGRDFDALAAALQADFRVACPDLPGRGRSNWLPVPAEYRPPVYMADMASLIARLGGDEVDWVGTSLGGLLGMMLAAQPNSPIRRLVVNDIGAFIAKDALQRISGYVGTDPLFADLDALEGYLREVHAPFGPLTDAQWRHLASHSARPDPAGGGLRLHYDPGLAAPFKEGFDNDVELWPVWDAITCPVLVLRGQNSDILSHETAQTMLTRGPEAELVELPGIGHAPMLMDALQIDIVRAFLLR
ncbi:MAG: alpha/beta hydrolase [Rhodospirillales bacterium]|nr:alpha/beta hydrolase [Rhodospirillales bacterium]